MPHALRTLLSLISFAVIGGALVGCGQSTEVHEIQSVTFANVDELFDAVDDELDCPETSSDHYVFTIPGRDDKTLQGRSCGDSILMAHSEDPTFVTDIQNLLAAHGGGPVPMVHNDHWFVMDITEVAGDSPEHLSHPGSRDLSGLASTWGAVYSEF